MSRHDLTLNTAACNTCDDLLRQENIQDKGGQEYNDHCRKHAGPVACVFHGVDHGIQSDRNRAHPVRVAEYQGNKILIPDIDKVEMVTVTMPGWAMGSMISQNVFTGGHPSMAAASSNALERLAKKVVRKMVV